MAKSCGKRLWEIDHGVFEVLVESSRSHWSLVVGMVVM